MEAHWTHNTAYHNWIISRAKGCGQVLDVGCGDGLLVQRLSRVCNNITGIDPHAPSAERAKQRLSGVPNTSIVTIGFEDYEAEVSSFDLIIFAASLHHMNQEYCIRKAKTLLAPRGKILVVGCANPRSFADWAVDIFRVLPARLGSVFHGEKRDGVGVLTANPGVSLADVRGLAENELPGAKIRLGLYYRYLLSWTKADTA